MRTLYHAGLAHGANHLVTLVTEAMEILSAAGAEDPAGTLRPLLTAALDNALDQGDAALTGPIVRGDVGTVRAHLEDLVANAPQTRAVVRRPRAGHARPGRHRRPRAPDPGPPHPRAARPRRGDRQGPRAAMTSRPALVRSRDELQTLLAMGIRYGDPVGLVPTMGALHEGHAGLLRLARERVPGIVVASIFVNPLQFGAGEDLDRYPRALEADLKLCEREGVDIVFAPSVDEVYPGGEPLVTIDPGPLGRLLEGAVRPTHFRGVLTVVAKLFGLVQPSLAVFGEKDYQQLVLIRRMVSDLCLGVEIVGGETAREPDGLALSSRNRYLDDARRRDAAVLSRALRAAQEAAAYGVDAALDAARTELGAVPDAQVDYLTITAPDLGDLPDPVPPGTEARVLVAARLGETRLIDNLPLTLGRTD